MTDAGAGVRPRAGGAGHGVYLFILLRHGVYLFTVLRHRVYLFIVRGLTEVSIYMTDAGAGVRPGAGGAGHRVACAP